jgi:S-adenosylmethionine/arginine decarboxylase-like enzyme
MSITKSISEILNTKILHTSQHSFEPSGTSLSSIIESDDVIFGSSGIAHLNESHISFHSYYENSINDLIILRLELHVSSCSRKCVYSVLNDLIENSLFNNYDALTLDFFHRGINLEQIEANKQILSLFFQKHHIDFNIIANDSFESFKHYKLIKKEEKIIIPELNNYLCDYLV